MLTCAKTFFNFAAPDTDEAARGPDRDNQEGRRRWRRRRQQLQHQLPVRFLQSREFPLLSNFA